MSPKETKVIPEVVLAAQGAYRKTFETVLAKQPDPGKPEISRSFAQGEEPDLPRVLSVLFLLIRHRDTSVNEAVFRQQTVILKLRPEDPLGDTFVFDIGDSSCQFYSTEPGKVPEPRKRDLIPAEINGLSQLLKAVDQAPKSRRERGKLNPK